MPIDCSAVHTIYQLSAETHVAISGCKDRKTEQFLAGKRVKEFQAFADAAAKSLTKLQAAVVLGDLRSPPSNRFEALRGDRKGQYSIRINAQHRVCFRWEPHASAPTGKDPMQTSGDAHDVEITDYH
jgi:proteic killer suppression protein